MIQKFHPRVYIPEGSSPGASEDWPCTVMIAENDNGKHPYFIIRRMNPQTVVYS